MNKLHLFFMTIYDNSIRILILTLGCFFSCALLLGIFYTADEYITVFSYARNGHIEDYVFVNDGFDVQSFWIDNSQQKNAPAWESDHNPVIVDLSWSD